ncbi:MAG TPA: hypothetical protein VNA19_01355 [Pyrinomonadaceae bacterium]|jgi:ppGpp synthetase/RelA/SpoT-type nucleotidyltranferase|nr:hypothetical protein [Pyrinomonadaceae bacterium]
MTKEMSKTQIDRLGDRLRKGNVSDDDLRLLDQYRLSFSEAYETVVGNIRKELSLEPTGRPAKSTTSISDKLRRESIRLTQIQDIAGGRLIVPDISSQESVVQSLENLFENTTIVDRRKQPSHGYRAVHVIVSYLGKAIEIQVRTLLQHQWAELSEKFSDIVNPAIKYGGGNESIQTTLKELSSVVATQEWLEVNSASIATLLLSQDVLTENKKQEMINIQQEISNLSQEIFEHLRSNIEVVEELKGENDDISDRV